MLRGRTLRFWRAVVAARVWLLPCVLLLSVTLPKLNQGDFRGDAGWYSAIGLQAWRTGNLWTLYGEPGQPYFNKPPLAFWIHGLALHTLGTQLWVARLPSILAATACVLLTVSIARHLAGRRAALLSGCVLALSLEFFRRTREISLDMWQAVSLLLAAWMLARAVTAQHAAARWWVLASGASVGLALITKPLVGFLFFPIAIAWLLWIGRARLAAWLAPALLVTLAIAAPWHLSMHHLHGREFLSQYFGVEIARRATGQLLAGHDKLPEPWFYFRKLGELYWPWLLFAIGGLIAFGRREWPRTATPAAKFAILWTGLWLLFLTIYPDRRDRYAIILYPGLAILAGLCIAHVPWAWLQRLRRNLLRAGGPIAALAAIALSIAPIRLQSPQAPHWPEIVGWVRDHGNPDLWQGGIGGYQGARLYLELGKWPITTRNRWGDRIADPPRGALLLYHNRGGSIPGPGETEVFRATNDDLYITRLDAETWTPTPAADPGE